MTEEKTVQLRIGSYSQASLVMIECLTSVHVGAGRRSAGSPVDLPIQRDAFEFPMISGSSLKGPIRQLFRSKKKDEDRDVFGKDAQGNGQHEDSDEEYYAGAVLILDARLLTIPVRSLKSIYVEATCPYMLSNFMTYAKACNDSRAAELDNLLKELPELRSHAAMTEEMLAEVSLPLNSGPTIILGDDGQYQAISSEVVGEIATLLELDRKKLVICHDIDMRDHILKRAIIVTQRIKIKEQTKTVLPGALWSEETLPQKTLLVSALLYSDSRNPRSETRTAEKIRKSVEEVLGQNEAIILGGDETVGRGLCRIRKLQNDRRA